MAFVNLTSRETGTVLVIAGVTGIIRYFQYDVAGGFAVLDIVFSTILAFITAITAFMLVNYLGWFPDSTNQSG